MIKTPHIYYEKNELMVEGVTVSGGELHRTLKADMESQKIVYSGVAKTAKEIKEAIEANILMLNVESEQELERINL